MRLALATLACLAAGCTTPAMLDAGPDARDAGPIGPLDVGADAAEGTDDAGSDAGAPDDTGGRDAGPPALRVTIERITDEHRFVPGAMFGGWGPHLGHLVRDGGHLYWVDDLCAQGPGGDCDVNVNRRIGVFRREGSSWTRVGTSALAGVQQNTGTIATSGVLRSYGVDVVAHAVTECRHLTASDTSSCSALPFDTGPDSNYVGAAVGPGSARVVWWTNVVDGGGGSFSYIVDYGGGWNGPRTGPVGGYNDFAYAHAGFEPGGPGLTFFGQVVAGRAPAWTFGTLVGEASLATTTAPTFVVALAPPASDAIESTNDLTIDDRTGDGHLLARSRSGGLYYYHRVASGTWSAPVLVDDRSYRGRFLVTDAVIAIVYGPNEGGLEARLIMRSTLLPGTPLPIAATPPQPITLPSGFGSVIAIYPEADATQTDAVGALDFGLVGSGREHEAYYVVIE